MEFFMERIRVGFIGAGGIARERHLPNLKLIEGVEVVAVANRSVESGERIAKEFGISEVMGDWRELVGRRDLDAVFIGTWPYMHREMSVAALESGKHVFCQARMAMNLAEAEEMVGVARRHKGLVNMVCPPPQRMPFEPWVREMISSGALGELTAVRLVSVSGGNRDLSKVHWREKVEFSGNQILAMGIFAETLNAWVGEYAELSANLATPISEKSEGGKVVRIGVPQVVGISGRLKNGAVCTELHSGVAADGSTGGSELVIWGMKGTIRYRFGEVIEWAKAGEELKAVSVPEEKKRGWRVELDFVEAVRSAMRGGTWKVSPDFEEGLAYMRKVEAVHVSAREGRGVRV
jgi:predicted dehydrogenase